MEYYISNGVELSVATGFIGALTGIYFLIYSSCSKHSFEEETNRIINTVCSVVKGEVRSLRSIDGENPYDLFTRIYPTLKDMDNTRISEFVNLVNNYNNSWVYENKVEEEVEEEEEVFGPTAW